MRSGKSFFNATLYKKNLTRFWPVWSLYLVIWMFVLPFDLILSTYSNPLLRFSQKQVLDSIVVAGIVLSVAFALLAAVAVWSYLYNNRATGLMHALPIRREGLFLTNFLSGMTFLAGPNLVIFLLTLLTEGLYGCVAVGPLVMWFFAVTLMGLFFFCFATFCAMFTGHILGLPAYYGILSGLPVGLVALLDAAFDRFVFGYDGIDSLYTLARWLTPIGNLAQSLDVRRVEEVVPGGVELAVHYEFPTLGYILVYAILGLILAGIALIVYRHRHMERAGDAVTVTWVRPVFQYGVAFCCALAFGVLFFEIFRGVLPETAWTLLVLMLISGTVGYFLARMILEKSFRVFGCWKGCLPFLAALVVLVCVMEFDVTGFERKVPAEKQVASVTVTGMYSMPYDEAQHGAIINSADPEIIHAVLDLHQTVVDNKKELDRSDYYSASEQSVNGDYYVATGASTGFNVSYFLKNGDVISRDYNNIPIHADEQEDLQTVSGKMNALINLPQVVESTYGLTDEKAENLFRVTLSSYYVDEDYDGYMDVEVSQEAWEDVLNAVKADLAEGNIGRRYLMNDQERMDNCLVNDLAFVFYVPVQEKTAVKQADVEVYVNQTMPVEYVDDKQVVTNKITVTLQTTAQHTLAALRRAGVLEGEVNLLTQAQMEQVNGKWGAQGGTWKGIDLTEYTWAVLSGTVFDDN